MARGNNKSQSSARSEIPSYLSSESRQKTEEIIKTYQRAKAYDGRIRDMSDKQIVDEVNNAKAFAIFRNAQINALKNDRARLDGNFKDSEARKTVFALENSLYEKILTYFSERRTENPNDGFSKLWLGLDKNNYNFRELEKEHSSLNEKLKNNRENLKIERERSKSPDADFVVSNSNIERFKKRIDGNKQDIRDMEYKSFKRLEEASRILKDTFGL
jgi:hypothetical protein